MMANGWTLLLLCLHISPVLCLKCLQCVGSSSTCRMVVRTCPSYETTCISLAYRSQGSSNTVMKGCSTTELCNQTSIINTGSRSIYMTATCCESNLCNLNRYSTAQVFTNRLVCNSCNSSTSSCSAPLDPLFCDEVSNYCVDLITYEWTNGVSIGSSLVKGCGSGNIGEPCTGLFAYNTGRYESYTNLTCCNNKDLCNTNSRIINKLPNNNGIYCFGCKETGKNECAVENQEPVKCKGMLIRCMEAFDENRKTIMKGCCTVNFCSSTFPSQEVSNISEIQCCAGSFCNNFTRDTSSPTTIVVSSSTRLNTDFRLSAFLISLIYVIRNFP
ncbi:urokinase plasminogen activator surface receptor-like [Rhinoderma darwinii]|uniref:urokinase plasminogen activator surface receptor-like n=1 Tax=Rhinoderma darwinii TaxID=43563 RepID=UPI003F6748BC